MINQTQERNARIEELIRRGYRISVSDYVREAYEIFKRAPTDFVVYTLILLVISAVLGQLSYMGQIAAAIVGPALNIGYAIAAQRIYTGQHLNLNDFFAGFSRLGQLFVANLLVALVTLAGLICFIIPGIYVAVAYCFVQMLVWFHFDGGYRITMDRSYRLISREWGTFFGLFVLLTLLNLGGILCLGVGLLITIPVSYISLYVCYEHLVGTTIHTEVHDEPATAVSADPVSNVTVTSHNAGVASEPAVQHEPIQEQRSAQTDPEQISHSGDQPPILPPTE